ADRFLPELPALKLEQDPVHKHKDVLRHTFAVVERCVPDLVLRLAALLHDIGKPRTRRVTEEGVQFHHHEAEGARMAEERLRARQLEAAQDELEERIARLAEEENLVALRPPLDGNAVMAHLGIEPGPVVGEALAYLMEQRMERGPIDEQEASELLDGWARERGLTG